MHYLVYRITNTLNGRYYIGAHSTNDINDSYMGSGELIKKAILKYGLSNFKKEILYEARDKREMYEKEKELVVSTYSDPLSYNMNSGGKGGWDHINRNPNHVSAMHNPEVAKKVSDALKLRFMQDSDYRNSLLKNCCLATAAATIVNTGKKKPEHSKYLRDLHNSGELGHPIRTGSTFEVFDPEGRNYIVSNLQEFCYNNGIPYVSLWNTHRTGKKIKKGKAKGWICHLQKKGHYEYIKP